MSDENLKEMMDPYGKLKEKHPDWNWKEAEEVSDDDLQAAAEYFDKLILEIKDEKSS